eukprot:5752903-Heterocapsa_arctica.AAC.1
MAATSGDSRDLSAGTRPAAHEAFPANRLSLRRGTRSLAAMSAAASPRSFAYFSGISMMMESLPLTVTSAPIDRTL